jgi:hypothetical protein
VIKIIAVLCSLSEPANCHEQTVTTSDFADVSMQSCMMGAPQLADWMKQHPTERLAMALRDGKTGGQGCLGQFESKTLAVLRDDDAIAARRDRLRELPILGTVRALERR